MEIHNFDVINCENKPKFDFTLDVMIIFVGNGYKLKVSEAGVEF